MNTPSLSGTVIGVALNYAPQAGELMPQFNAPPHGRPPRTPVCYVKPANTLCGDGDPVPVPDGETCIEPGPALAAVIGERAWRIAEQDAAACIAGYTLLNDFSMTGAGYFRPPVRSRGFDGSGPMGPAVAPAADIGDPHALQIRTQINGEPRARAETGEVVYAFPALIAFLSDFMTLNPGDVIASLFPLAVTVTAGDEVSIEVPGIGRLTNRVVGMEEFEAFRKEQSAA